jgi:hypothetical protein
MMGYTLWYATVSKAGGRHSQEAEGAAVVKLLQTLGSAGYGALRLWKQVRLCRLRNRMDPPDA